MAAPASPRLPSPPPIPEDQLSPVSASPEQQKFFSNLDHAAERRIRPGTKAEDMAEGPPLVELSEIDSAFQLTEHLKALHYSLTHPEGSDSTMPVDRDMALRLAQAPENVDKILWLYELCRLLTQKVNSIIVALFSDSPPCSSLTCPEMRASEWQYLCAVHDPPKSCCAIDYCCHTLDWAGNTLTSPKHFPSRLALGTDQSTQHSQQRQLTNIFRRVYRIFAHAWFQHREMFWKVEGRTGLYVFYKTVCDVYNLIPEDNYTVPAEAEGIEPDLETRSSAPPLILKREPLNPGPHEDGSVLNETMSDHTLSTAGTTKRHRHSPSVGATAVHTVVEENEEEEERPTLQSQQASQVLDLDEEQDDITVIEDTDTADEAEEAKGGTSTSTAIAAAAQTPNPDAEERDTDAQDENEDEDEDETENEDTADSLPAKAQPDVTSKDSAGAESPPKKSVDADGDDASVTLPVEKLEKLEASGEGEDKGDNDTRAS
ncbi:hypothetical protein ACN47E_006868 [Coniothyrium glycines]